MSYKVTMLVYSRKTGSHVRKSILAYMADLASHDGTGVWASKQTIADEIECGRSTVIRACNDFVAEGILIPTGSRKCANGSTVEYALDLEAIAALPVIEKRGKGSQSGTSPNRDQSRSGTPPVPERDPKGSQSGTQTILEPSLNRNTPIVPSPSKQKSRKSSIPANAVISDEMREIAEAEKISQEEAAAQFDRFRDYAVANGKTYANWNAAWRNWLRSPFFKPITGGSYDNRTRTQQTPQRSQNRPDPALEQIARLAGLG
ncbi:helix-turn-helix domain-containing protein [Profundibacterium mesophilum]|uniref:Helix-turn-helix domain protein n=1 Tax=Profundibacterium mesophilum KAUST100406-0324 TaxID=1037889 RepID=A0A921NRN9_9RHOB|nr:helix-turn-helix domain-containing protein [Profundibacterium mesophilum]KAF0675094.1 Helix-turn-helix domain protein [Profundibacterium mesophilum KAUST100406-0324]